MKEFAGNTAVIRGETEITNPASTVRAQARPARKGEPLSLAKECEACAGVPWEAICNEWEWWWG